MTDTRPILTDTAFEEAARYVDERWWMTGENLIHVPAVMNVEGWKYYGSPGNLLLTPAQRILMMWADIVGQVSNGGFTQYVENYADDLALGVAAVDALEWPELRERFARAMEEQAGDTRAPKWVGPVALTDDPEKWRASRKRLIRHLARRGKPWWKPTSKASLAFVEQLYPEWRLELEYQRAVFSGKLRSGGERLFDFVPPPTHEADAFDSWFYADSTKAASITYVGAYLLKVRDQLYRRA
ncbi:DMP19 family protein [Sphingomonas sp. HT-1]|uniref:DMP19 family protein n=1 Tax=unclassified Sphingomonas TaxID=196159 RepID=UPI00031BB207|nr:MULTISPECIES: hypothetical protein [unclassified Sphingomonas]KTF67347.1 hypothetical protein ATB93_17895 [Sphingomonas sp. WG]